MKIRWTNPALTQLDAIQDYIAQDDPVAAHTLITAILSHTDMLQTMPQMGRSGRVASTREWVMPEIPYIAVYRVTPSKYSPLFTPPENGRNTFK